MNDTPPAQRPRRRIVVIGATSAIAEQCVRLWLLAGPADLVLIGRNETKLRRFASDLAVRAPASGIECVAMDFLDESAIQNTVAATCAPHAPDLVLIAHGSLPDQADCQSNLTCCRDALEINGVSPVLFAEAFVTQMQPTGGIIIVMSSVAGDRGRQSNYVYGSAKGMVTRYVQGLQHRLTLSGSALKVILVKPGPTATPMTAHLTVQGQVMARVEDVAQAIVNGAAKAKPVIYAPGQWGLIMMVVRHLPRFILHRLRL